MVRERLREWGGGRWVGEGRGGGERERRGGGEVERGGERRDRVAEGEWRREVRER